MHKPGRESRASSGYYRAAALLASLLGAWLALQALLGVGAGFDLAAVAAAAPLLLRGLGLTIYITLASVLLGAVVGAGLVAGLGARSPAARAAATAWCTVWRGAPAIAELYLVYYGAGEIHGLLATMHLWWFFRDPLGCVIFAFTLNTAAYQARIVHGAIVNLPREQTDAAMALALPRRIAMLRVLLPQALLTALRPLGNEVTKMTKVSAVASLVTVLDLLGTADYLYTQTFDFGFYILAAVLYVLLVGAIRLGLDVVEQHLSRHLRPAAG